MVGWSHKYREVLDDFGLSAFGMDSAVLADPSSVVDAVVDCTGRRDEISAMISAALPAVQEKSARNFSVIHRAASGAAA